MNNTTIGELVKYFRKKKGLSQENLAIGICSTRQIINIEKNMNLPTIDLLSHLSEALGVNLIEVYSDVSEHNGLETYLDYLKLDNAIANKKMNLIKEYVDAFEDREGFKTGVPRQLILHAKSIIYSVNGNIDIARECELEGIRTRHPSFSFEYSADEKYSEIDIAQMITYAVYLCRGGRNLEGLLLLEKTEDYIREVLDGSNYVVERKRPIWNNLWCSLVINEYYFGKKIEKGFLQKIDDVLDYQVRSGRIYRVVELLLCKAAVLMRIKQKDKAMEVYQISKSMAGIYYSYERFKKEADSIINHLSDISLFE